MDGNWIPLCASADLIDGGKGVRFAVTAFGDDATAFAVRYNGGVHAYLNRCAHVPMELDWNQGDFFDLSGLYIVCATHGAAYAPESGHCIAGPCRGARLRPVMVMENDDQVFWQPDEYIRPVQA
jgi:nitrite reductase/ring-hydroxylating ferredoxin subunit